MIITGSVLVVEPGTAKDVLQVLESFPEVTFQVASESGTELVVNLEALDEASLDQVCGRLKESIPQIIDISHMYVNFEEEVERILRTAGGGEVQEDSKSNDPND